MLNVLSVVPLSFSRAFTIFDGIGLDAPVSAGLIRDVFAEYEKTFAMPRGD